MAVKNLNDEGESESEEQADQFRYPIDETEAVLHDGKPIFRHHEVKQENIYFRWNLLWLVLLILGLYPLVLTWFNCTLSYEITILVNLVLQLNFLYASILCWQFMWRMIKSFNTPFWEKCDVVERDKVQHIVVLPTYKEPIELLLETISTIANQSVDFSIIMVVGMEEGTNNQEEKKRAIRKQFHGKFKALHFTVHPSGVPGEIRGACSNRNYTARHAVKYMLKHGMLQVDKETKEVELDNITVTVCDADTKFFCKYFEFLTWSFLNEDPDTRYKVCWQSPLFYNIALDDRWFFTRVIGILRAYFMVGFLIGLNINTMSVYSMSLRLLIESKFFNPKYAMDDFVFFLKAMEVTGKRVKIKTIDLPTLSGPTSGVNFIDEIREWHIQAVRWTIGAAESFHYFFVKMLEGNGFPRVRGIVYFWQFVYHYGFVLCVSGVIQICQLIVAFISIGYTSIQANECKPMGSWFNLPSDFDYNWLMNHGWIYFYIVAAGTAYFMDALVVQILALDESMHIARRLLHFLAAQPVLWMYCIEEYYAIFKMAVCGRNTCGHKAAEKHALAGVGKTADSSGHTTKEMSSSGYVSSVASPGASPRRDSKLLVESLRGSFRTWAAPEALLAPLDISISSDEDDESDTPSARKTESDVTSLVGSSAV